MKVFIILLVIFDFVLLSNCFTKQEKQDDIKILPGNNDYNNFDMNGNVPQESNDTFTGMDKDFLDLQSEYEGNARRNSGHPVINLADQSTVDQPDYRDSVNELPWKTDKKFYQPALVRPVPTLFRNEIKDNGPFNLWTNQRNAKGFWINLLRDKIGRKPHKTMFFSPLMPMLQMSKTVGTHDQTQHASSQKVRERKFNPIRARFEETRLLMPTNERNTLKKMRSFGMKLKSDFDEQIDANSDGNEKSQTDKETIRSKCIDNTHEKLAHDFRNHQREKRSIDYPDTDIQSNRMELSPDTFPQTINSQRLLSQRFYNMISHLLQLEIENGLKLSKFPERMKPQLFDMLKAYGKRRFNSWGGKRSRRPSFSSWGGKRSTKKREPLDQTSDLPNGQQYLAENRLKAFVFPAATQNRDRRRVFHSWGGKRNTFYNRKLNEDPSDNNSFEVYAESYERKLPDLESEGSFWELRDVHPSRTTDKGPSDKWLAASRTDQSLQLGLW